MADYEVARECGVAPRTVRAWRDGSRRIPERVLADLRRLRAERARRKIDEGKRELAEIIAEGGEQ